jgi:hypothetical protein
LNDKEKSLKYLSEAVELGQGSTAFNFFKINPMVKNLWDEPEFKTIMEMNQEKLETVRSQINEMRERGEISL